MLRNFLNISSFQLIALFGSLSAMPTEGILLRDVIPAKTNGLPVSAERMREIYE